MIQFVIQKKVKFTIVPLHNFKNSALISGVLSSPAHVTPQQDYPPIYYP